jgi:hypothetical protein
VRLAGARGPSVGAYGTVRSAGRIEAAKVAALQTAREYALTSADIITAACFGTHLAQTPASMPACPRQPVPQSARDPLLAKYAHVVGYRRWPGTRPLACLAQSAVCPASLWSGVVVSSATTYRLGGRLTRCRQLQRSWWTPVSSSSGYRPVSRVSAPFWHVAGMTARYTRDSEISETVSSAS